MYFLFHYVIKRKIKLEYYPVKVVIKNQHTNLCPTHNPEAK